MTWQLIKDALLGKEQDFTRLPLKTAIFLLALPMILEMMMESSFALVDIFFVAQLGEYAIATVGLTESVIVLTYALGFGLSMAATPSWQHVGTKMAKMSQDRRTWDANGWL